MRRVLFITSLLFLLSFSSFAQANVVAHSLDGSTIDYVYSTLGPVHVDLSDGQFKWHWANIPNGPKEQALFESGPISQSTLKEN